MIKVGYVKRRTYACTYGITMVGNQTAGDSVYIEYMKH